MRILIALLLLSSSLSAALSPIGAGLLQVFDEKAKELRPRPAAVAYQPEPEILQIHLPGFEPSGPLNARLHVDQLPYYDAWVARRKKEGGLAWTALSGLLDEVQGRPAVFLTFKDLPTQGPAEVHVGLMEGKRFELFARVQGTVASGKRGLVFEITDFHLEKASARAAWSALAPLARKQAVRMAGQR